MACEMSLLLKLYSDGNPIACSSFMRRRLVARATKGAEYEAIMIYFDYYFGPTHRDVAEKDMVDQLCITITDG